MLVISWLIILTVAMCGWIGLVCVIQCFGERESHAREAARAAGILPHSWRSLLCPWPKSKAEVEAEIRMMRRQHRRYAASKEFV